MKTMREILRVDSSDDFDMQTIGKFLSFASRGDRVGLNQMLIQGISPDVQDYDNRTALHLAASEGHTPIVELLVCYKANVNLKDRWKRTPLTDARLYGHRDICRILEVNGGNDFTNDQLMTVRHEEDSNDVKFDMSELSTEHSSTIRQGSFGESERVKWRGTWVVKTVVKRQICNPVKMILSAKDNTLLRELRHPNILQFLGSIVQQEEMVLITEYLPKGNLENILRQKARLDLPTAFRYALDIARGMNYLHQHKPCPIVHNHLGTRNLLQDEGGHLKIGEYWVQMLYEPINPDQNGKRSNPRNIENLIDGTKKDVRTFGFIFYQMLEGRHFMNSTNSDTKNEEPVDFKPKFHLSRCTNRIHELIEDCTSNNPSEIPSFGSVIEILEEESSSFGRAVCPC
ncbi:serine/threonine-protein kinase CTR1-like [Pyrus ussuriensis x Pyrus communis]|uniref:Serine/threonine-protein kinase CTR1-like n=1 Tax=Pyrus ussuriensis x Pyrus communis TaxID=2448454 RepID=A0A5N5G8B3_9ROSA|nr:serine/threonine-protein kinase CTR1-like [Pyrus ussuriensis x Pyrus communis]